MSEALQERPSDMFTLPSSEETLTLIHRYFADTGLLFPYIHPPTFFDTYYQLKNNSKRVRRTWLGLLNIILAMAKLTSASGRSPAETCISESAVYYRRALDLCKGEILRGTTLEVGKISLLCSYRPFFPPLISRQYSIYYSWASTFRGHRSRFRRGRYMAWPLKLHSSSDFIRKTLPKRFLLWSRRHEKEHGLDVWF